MNLTRYIYLESFLESIINTISELSSSKQIWNKKVDKFVSCVTNEISFQTLRIYERQNSSVWGITSSDEDFVKKLSRIKLFLVEYATRLPKTKRELNRTISLLKSELSCLVEFGRPKLKVVFLTQETFGWPSFQTVYDAFIHSNDAIVDLVYIPFEHVNNDKNKDWFLEYEKLGLQIKRYETYPLALESPDIAFFVKPYDGIPKSFYIDAIDQVVPRNVYIPYFVNWMSPVNIDYLIKYHFQLPLQYKAWRIFDAPLYTKELHKKYGFRNGDNVISFGHPRFDLSLFLEEFRRNITDSWKEKIQNKKVILWNTHVIMSQKNSSNSDWSTFEEIGMKLLNIFHKDEFKDAVLLWRPHPSFFAGLLNSGRYTEKDVEEIIAFVDTSPNIILDRSIDYRNAFSISDGLISDASSFLVEYLICNKPILYTHKKNAAPIVNSSLLPAFSEGDTWKSIIEFIKMVVKEKDHLRNERENVINTLGLRTEGCVGENIKNYCIKELINEEIKSGSEIISLFEETI